MSQIFKPQEQEKEENDFKLDLRAPKTTDLQAKIREQHQAQAEEEEKAEKQGKPQKKRKKPKNTSICFCGHPPCGIGPFVEQQGQGGDVE